MSPLARSAAILTALAAVALAGAAVVIYTGAYNIAATEQHLAPTYYVLDTAMRASVERRSRDLAVPPLDQQPDIDRGLALYRAHCVQCHGAPGVAPEPFALGLMPAPANLAYTARTWRPAALFWVVKHGIRTTGMPAWQYRLEDADLWAIVAFLQELPRLSPDDYAAREPVAAAPARAMDPRTVPDAKRGERALQQYACVTCHEIPGVVGAIVPVGPPLTGMATRRFVAGMLPNTPDNLVRWLRAPRQVNPRTAMPDLGVTEGDARDIAAFLYTLR